MKYYYNLNGLLTFSIDANKKKLDYINNQYSYFRCDEKIDDVDIAIVVAPFQTPDTGYSVINRKYHVKGDCIWAEDSYKVAKWKFMIDGLKAETTKVYFEGNFWSYYILYKFFIEPIIRFKLNEFGYFMIHSSSVSSEKGALVFPASPSVGKTSTMLNWLNEGRGFIADEFTILDKGYAYGYPTPLRLHDYNLKANPFVKKDMGKYDIFQIYVRTWILRLSFGYADLTHEVDVWNAFPKVEMVNKKKISAIVIFTKHSAEHVEIEELTKEELINRLLIINRFETSRFTEYLQAYDYVNNTEHNSQFWEKMRCNGQSIFADQTYISLKIPKYYTKETFEEINCILSKLENGQ